MSGVQFTVDERRAFEDYCALLVDIVNRDAPSDARAFQGVVCRAGLACNFCGGRVPAGIPVEMKHSNRVACPACVVVKQLPQALRTDLASTSPALTEEEIHSLLESSIVPANVRGQVPGSATHAPGVASTSPQSTKRAPPMPRAIEQTIARLEATYEAAGDPEERERIARLIASAKRAA